MLKLSVKKDGLRLLTRRLAGSSSLAALLVCSTIVSGSVAHACDDDVCTGGVEGDAKVVYDGAGTTDVVVVGDNQERGTGEANPNSAGFSISYDGEQVAGDEAPVDVQRQTDIDLSQVNIQVKFDGLGVAPTLNISTKEPRYSYRGGDRVEFSTNTNYPAWIERAEIRILDREAPAGSAPLQVIPVTQPVGSVGWEMPSEGPKAYSYVYRVYDNKGRFDETLPLGLRRTTGDFDKHEAEPEGDAVAPGRGEDRTATRSIPVYGGAVTVFGRDVPQGYSISAIGEKIPVDTKGAFVVQRILPPGDHAIDVDVVGDTDQQVQFSRDINIPENEWFYVALADLTVGKRFGSESLVDADPGDYKSTYTKGRLAFYLKGKIKGRYLLTAAADTGEDDIQNLFRNLDAKDPRQLLRRIDPDKYYPVYGDDSKTVEDAPTSGKFYVKLERGDSHVMWGNYKTSIKGTELARNERALYGAHARYKSEKTTTHGKAKVQAEAYASQPGTLPQRDSLRGTGGSVYFLTRQDLNRGSETITVEVRDRVTGLVTSRTVLRYGEDYEINYTQGVVLLTQPLPSTASSDTIVTGGTLSGNENYLVVQYEFTPGLDTVDGYSYGGRVQAWVTDNVRVGATGMSEKTGSADQKILAGDVRVKLGKSSYVQVEAARTKGPGFGQSSSIDGGLTIDTTASAGTNAKEAWGLDARLHIDLADIDPAYKGVMGLYYQRRDEGFSSLGYNTTVAQRTFGGHADFALSDHTKVKLKYEDFKDADGKAKREGDAQIEYKIDPFWSIGLGVKHTHLNASSTSINDGSRTDIGARLTYSPDEDQSYYLFGQGTVQLSGNLKRNNRIGVGFEKQLTEKLGVLAEISTGSLGLGGLASLTYSPTADDKYYIGYKLDPNRQYESTSGTGALVGTDHGAILLGARHRYNDDLSVYMENNYDMFGARRSLTSTYGVKYTPTAKWTVNGGVEYGDVFASDDSALERVAVSMAVSYRDEEKYSWNLKAEARFEDSDDNSKDRNTYLVKGGVSIKHNENWRFLGSFKAALSDSDQTSILDGDYVEASVGYAYRPVDNDRLNGLFKYTFLYDLPGPDQVTVSQSTLGPAQRSHILSADFSYDLTQHLTVGAKYGFRIGEVSTTRSADDFVESSAHLGVLRADFHVIKNWDVMVEGRVLHTPEIDTTKYGFVAAAYRHFGDNFKVGVGYNFGQFSDNVADLTYDDGGIFINMVGKF